MRRISWNETAEIIRTVGVGIIKLRCDSNKGLYKLTPGKMYELKEITATEEAFTVDVINDNGIVSSYSSRLFIPYTDAECMECGEKQLDEGCVLTHDKKTYCYRCAGNLHIHRCRGCDKITTDVKYTYLGVVMCLKCYSELLKANPLTKCSFCKNEIRKRDARLEGEQVFCNRCFDASSETVYLGRLTGSPLNYFLRKTSNKNPKERTFGVELEVNSKNTHPVLDYSAFMKELNDTGVRPLLFAQHDGSLTKHVGVEFDTIILKGEEGRNALRKIVYVLNKYFTTDDRCGLHIHIGVNDLNDKGLQSLYYVYTGIEKYLKLYVAPRRWNSEWAQRQCAKIRPITKPTLKGTAIVRESFERHRSINFEAVREHGTLEIRLMEGNLDIDKILHWLMLHMQIINYVAANQSLIDDDKYIVGKNLKLIFGEFYNDLRERLRKQSSADIQRKKKSDEKKLIKAGFYDEASFVDTTMWRI